MISDAYVEWLERRIDDLLTIIDSRLGPIEKRLDEAKIPEVPIPDDECAKYYTLPGLFGTADEAAAGIVAVPAGTLS